ncbi:MAG: DarT ssDNA thymidine ADP-ribosyltransferase family protein, partial [Acidobacteriota bacterium]
RARPHELNQIAWPAIDATDFRETGIKEKKQAEFLVHDRFPLVRFERIGVFSKEIRTRVASELAHLIHRPTIEVRQDWYF